MKKLIALLAVCALCFASVAYAAEWGEGLGPARPYERSAEVDLSKIIGYIMLNPTEKMPAEHFCDTLRIYLPREDVQLGAGRLRLYNAGGEVAAVDFADERNVALRPMSEEELNGLIWGSGVCIEVFLPVSLRFGESYYVTLDEGCFTAADGSVVSFAIKKKSWVPVLSGDFGVSGLYYSDRVEPKAPAAEGEAPAAGQPTAEEIVGTGKQKSNPEVDDVITFDLVLGGDAKVAVVFSENNSVYFPEPELSESGTVNGLVIGEELDWGVVFLDERGEILSVVNMGR